MDKLEIAYTVDLLARLTESIEIYLDDDRSGIETVMLQEVKEAKKLVKKFYKRIREESEQAKKNLLMDNWLKETNKNIREGKV